MIDINAWLTRASLLVAFVATLAAIGLFYNNYTLANNNAELAHYVTTKLDSMESNMAALETFRLESVEALRSGVPGAYLAVVARADSILRKVEDE